MAYFFAEHDIPLAVADHLTPLLPILFPDSRIASTVHAGRTKMTAALHTVADSMHVQLVSQMRNGFFSIVPGESTDISVFEQVAVVARVVDTADGFVKSYSFGIKPITSASAANIFGNIEELLKGDKIPWENMIAFGSYGANVMRGSKNSVLTRLEKVQPHLYSIHCTCHQLHLCAQAACQCIPPQIEDFVRSVAYFFEKSAKRLASFKEFQAAANVPLHILIKPSSTRWLSLQESISRVLEQWDALLQYFTQDKDARKVPRVQEWAELMTVNSTKAYLYFLKEALLIFTGLNRRYQTSSVLIHKLYDDQKEFLNILILNCIKQSILNQTADFLTLDLDNEAIWIDCSDLVISIHASDIVTDMPFFEKNSFLSVCREFYLVVAKQVKRRLPLSCLVLSTLRFLCPERGKERSSREIADLARRFPNIVPPENITELQREWQRYQTNNTVGSPHDTVDHHWNALSKMKDASGCQEFPLLSRFTSGMLVIPHASADIERNFSKMGYDKTKTRNSVGTSLLNSLVTIGCNRGHMTCLTFKPTSLMRQELSQHVAKAAGRFKGTESTCTAKGTSDGGNPEGSTNRSVVVSQSSTLTRPNPWPLHDNLTGPDIKSQINCRSSHVLKHAAFSCKRPSTTTIDSQPVSKASKVRAATSKGDATKADRANAFEFLQSIVNNQNPKEILTWGSEYLLAPSLCQFRIDGRDGSNACTVIAAQVCRQILLQENSLSLPPDNFFGRYSCSSYDGRK